MSLVTWLNDRPVFVLAEVLPDKQALEGRLVEILHRISGADPALITAEARLMEDIGIDSLGFYEILIEADTCFGIRIPEETSNFRANPRPPTSLSAASLNIDPRPRTPTSPVDRVPKPRPATWKFRTSTSTLDLEPPLQSLTSSLNLDPQPRASASIVGLKPEPRPSLRRLTNGISEARQHFFDSFSYV